MPLSSSYDGALERILRAVKKNLEGTSSVVLVHEEEADPIRPDNLTGRILKITDNSEDFLYKTAAEMESTLLYTVEGFLQKPASGTIRQAVRTFFSDVIRRMHADRYLSVADAANGNSGAALVKEHRCLRVKRQYGQLDGYFRADFRARFSWNADM